MIHASETVDLTPAGRTSSRYSLFTSALDTRSCCSSPTQGHLYVAPSRRRMQGWCPACCSCCFYIRHGQRMHSCAAIHSAPHQVVLRYHASGCYAGSFLQNHCKTVHTMPILDIVLVLVVGTKPAYCPETTVQAHGTTVITRERRCTMIIDMQNAVTGELGVSEDHHFRHRPGLRPRCAACYKAHCNTYDASTAEMFRQAWPGYCVYLVAPVPALHHGDPLCFSSAPISMPGWCWRADGRLRRYACVGAAP